MNRLRNIIILYERQKGMCPYCKQKLLELVLNDEDNKSFSSVQIDHRIPKSEGGTDSLDNLDLICSYCNNLKKDKDVEEFQKWLEPYNSGKVKDIRKLAGYHRYLQYKKIYEDQN